MKLQKESPAGCAGEGNRVMEISRRGKDGLKINPQEHFVRKKVSDHAVQWYESIRVGVCHGETIDLQVSIILSSNYSTVMRCMILNICGTALRCP